MATRVFGAAVIGPKIGNGFFANLYGHYGQLTMDRWLMRTWGRWTGTLVKVDAAAVKRKSKQLPTIIKMMTPKERKAFAAIIGRPVTGKIEDVALAVWKSSQKPANRELMNAIGPLTEEPRGMLTELLGRAKANQPRTSLDGEIRKMGNGLTKAIDGQKEAPAGSRERDFIRQVFGAALAEMQKTRPNLTMADLQAVLLS